MKLFILFLFFSINALAANRQDLKSNLVGIGLNDTSDKVLEFNAASGTARAKLRSNISTSKLQFTNDGITYKDLGSGSGGGGYNLLSANSDFESNVTTGWVVSGATAVRTLYPVQGSDNKSYALVTTTEANGYYESVSQTVTSFLGNGDIQNQALIMPVSGTWFIQTLSGTTVLASQTLTVSSDFQKSPLIFTPAGASQTIIKQRFTALVSSSVLAIDNTYLGETVNLKNGAVVGPWQSYTVGCSGTWITTTTYACRKRQVGDEYEYEYVLTLSGAATATGLTLNTDTIDVNKLGLTNNFSIGQTTADDNGVATYSGSVGYNSLTTVLPLINSTGGTYAVPAAISNTAPFTWGSGDKLTVRFKVPIVGLSGSSTTFDSRCPNDISCENEFSADVSTGNVVTNENLDWITTCSGSSTKTCNFNAGVFTSTPVCQVVTAQGSSAFNSISARSTTSITIVSYDSNGALFDAPISLSCRRGSDSVTKRTIEGYLSKTVTSTGNFVERMERVRIVGTTENTNCTTSPCTLLRNSGGFSSVTRGATGTYVINFVAGTWSDVPVCHFTAGNGANAVFATPVTAETKSTTQFSFNVYTDTATLADARLDIVCHGPR